VHRSARGGAHPSNAHRTPPRSPRPPR
jgi:hypothetical protein